MRDLPISSTRREHPSKHSLRQDEHLFGGKDHKSKSLTEQETRVEKRLILLEVIRYLQPRRTEILLSKTAETASFDTGMEEIQRRRHRMKLSFSDHKNLTDIHVILLLEQEEDSSRAEREKLGDRTSSTKPVRTSNQKPTTREANSVVGSPPDKPASRNKQRPKKIIPNRRRQSNYYSTRLRTGYLHAPPRYIS